MTILNYVGVFLIDECSCTLKYKKNCHDIVYCVKMGFLPVFSVKVMFHIKNESFQNKITGNVYLLTKNFNKSE